MPPLEYLGWQAHFRRHPPGDPLTQLLLAHLCAMVATIGGSKSTARQFAPWLYHREPTRAERNAIIERAAERNQSWVRDQMAAIMAAKNA